MSSPIAQGIRNAIRDVSDFPKPGIVFKDITPLLADARLFSQTIDLMAAPYLHHGIEKVIGIESRGFLLATAVAYQLNAGVVPVRKKGKLPYKTTSVTYALEYGQDSLEIHEDAVEPGAKVLIVDDVLATGGTAQATCELLEKAKADIAGLAFLIELSFLKGREKIKDRQVFSLIQY